MKRISPVKKSERHNVSEDSEPDYNQQYVKHFEDTRSLVAVNDKLQKTKKSFLLRCNESDSDSDCSHDISKKVCEYCKKGKHSVDDCPLFMNAIKQQSNMLCTYNASSSNHLKQMNHFAHYDETDQQPCEVSQKAQNEYLRKHCDNDTESCEDADQQHLNLLQKAQQEYYSKRCKHCKEYGHLADACIVLDKAMFRQSEDNWRDAKTNKSKRSKTNKTLKTEVHNLSKIDPNASACAKETKENYFSKYCHYCKEYGHTENICPLVQKILKRQKGKNITVSPKIHKKNSFTNTTAKVKDFRKLKICNFCGNSDHNEDDCTEKNQYFKKHGHNGNEQVQLKDLCPSLEDDVKKLKHQNHKFYLNSQKVTSDLNSNTSFQQMKTLSKCNFCAESDHSESECDEKLQYEYISKYCHICDEYGHVEDNCPLIEQAAREMEDESYCEVIPNSPKKVTFAKDVTTLTQNLDDLKICHICDEFGHNENDCFVKQQAEFYSKYCDRCKENGHCEEDCVLNKQSCSNSRSSNSLLQKELVFKTISEYATICSEHYVCKNCHDVYSLEPNSSASERRTSKNVKKTTFQSSFEANNYRLRYCTLCGIEGLIDTCILKKRAATE